MIANTYAKMKQTIFAQSKIMSVCAGIFGTLQQAPNILS